MLPEEDIVFQEKYLIGRKIGSGSFGSILLATDIDTGQYVAMKFVNSSHLRLLGEEISQ